MCIQHLHALIGQTLSIIYVILIMWSIDNLHTDAQSNALVCGWMISYHVQCAKHAGIVVDNSIYHKSLCSFFQVGLLLLESLLLLGYFSLFHAGNQAVLRWGKSPTILHKVNKVLYNHVSLLTSETYGQNWLRWKTGVRLAFCFLQWPGVDAYLGYCSYRGLLWLWPE